MHCDLNLLIEQLSVVYCEVYGIVGGSDDSLAEANPVEGRSIFVPDMAGY